MHNADVHHRAGPGVQAVTATTRAATGASDSAACIWLPELISHIADFMPRNEVACCLRLVNRAAAAALQGARYTTIRLSEHVPHAAFARRWAAPDASRRLTSAQRRQLLALTAAAGETRNLQLLLKHQWAGALTPELFCAAAAGGHLAACELLRRRGCPWGSWTTAAAAGAGRRALVASGVPQGWDWRSAQAAAKAGHVELAAWLLPRVATSMTHYKSSFLAAAAEGCTLRDLRRFMLQVLGGQPPAAVAAAAAAEAAVAAEADMEVAQEARGCRTEPGSDATAPGSGSGSGSGPGSGSTSQTTSGEEEDEGEGEADEVESPEELFTDLFQDAAAPLSPAEAPHSAMASIQAVRRCGDWRQRLDWLAGRGYRLSAVAASAAADAGNAEALEYLLGRVPSASYGREISSCAARGDLPVLRLLRPYMARMIAADAAEMAATHGQLEVVAWLLEGAADMRQEPGADGGSDIYSAGGRGSGGGGAAGAAAAPQGAAGHLLSAALFRAAAKSGSVALLRWLRDRGCAWDSRAWVSAAADSSQEVVEWLAEAGCPMPADGEPYLLPACEGDTPMLRCLHRLGCPLGPPGGGLLTRVLSTPLAPVDGGALRGLMCLVEELGCSVDWEAALQGTETWRGRDKEEVAAWLRRLRGEREGREGQEAAGRQAAA
eukprot:XP_001697008.1 predicted protein [Chlamydomonas reinhardtii]